MNREITPELRNRLRKMKESFVKNRPKTILDDDYCSWQELTDYYRKKLLMDYLSACKEEINDKSELKSYVFSNIQYDKIKRKIISMEYHKK
jgi:hypothetical protein